MAHTHILHDDIADVTIALDRGLTVTYVEVPVEGLDDPQEVVEVAGDRQKLEAFLEEFELDEYRITE